MVAARTRILLVTGSTRGGSANTAALRTMQAVAARPVTAVLYEGLSGLPAFNPDDDREPLPPAAGELRRQIAAADAVVFCTPEYAGTLPGSFKNLLDWTVGGGEMYGKPTAWINVAAPGRGAGAEPLWPACSATSGRPSSRRRAGGSPCPGRRWDRMAWSVTRVSAPRPRGCWTTL